MSENGPYNQPPQNPYGGGEHGAQPPYGQPQPPQGGAYGDPGTGGQPGYGAGYPGGAQPPYGPGGPGGPGFVPPPPQPPKSGGGKAGLWVVIVGGVVIVILVIAVLVTVLTNGSPSTPVIADPTETVEDDVPTDAPAPATDTTPAGEPPYAVPAEPCDAFTEQVQTDFLLTEEGEKSVQDTTSRCSSTLADAPEGNDSEDYASLRLTYSVPYSASDSIERATEDFQAAVEDVTGASDYSLYIADGVEDNREVDLGDQAQYVVTRYDYAGDEVPQAVLLIRSANLNIRIEYQVSPGFLSDGDPEDLVLPDNTEEIMLNAGAEALALVGT
ncbi:DUF3558 domain-containing protein [Nocardiopsis sp. FIRDI 009]|uniref:DUF3558 domain-containing protein n=1 Tax=Nocardiopsis sp. FIRDI 009 TaxID=714197 RepID=UPI000E2768A1|nr:DUF3558 domain-containing protein [Nocardiopsis sp. FIRDI 009]